MLPTSSSNVIDKIGLFHSFDIKKIHISFWVYIYLQQTINIQLLILLYVYDGDMYYWSQ